MNVRHLLGIAGVVLATGLAAPIDAGAQVVIRGPYLQKPTDTSMVVRWRTDVASDSRVSYGTTQGSLGTMVDDATLVTDHEIEVAGLSPGTQYFYSVGTTTTELAGNDADHWFNTNPSPGTVQPIRMWAIGDSGFADPADCIFGILCDAPAVRDAYLAFPGAGATDLFLLLGDNAYLTGTDGQFQDALFDQHLDFLRRVPAIPTFGNHEAGSSDSLTEIGPWFDMFTNPTSGEAGGVMSGSESYFSYDFANVHIIVLDSQGGTRASMLTWVESDIMSATADWIIAFWHHPPYSKGVFHDSDLEGREINMRVDVLPILEDNGVDLVLTGHSHSYERSNLLDGHYGLSPTLTSAMVLDSGDGDPAGDGSYRKASTGPAGNEGAVYVVAGSSSEVRQPLGNHPAHEIGLLELGSLVVDIDGDTLTGQFLNHLGAVTDSFQIDKGVSACPASPLTGCDEGAKGKIVLKKGATADTDRLSWKWKKVAIDPLDLGDPTDQTDIAVCAYDATGQLLGGSVRPGDGGSNPNWVAKPSGFSYKDSSAADAGVQKMRIIPGDATRAKLSVKGKGAGLGLGTLPVTLPIVTQLSNLDGGGCWESTFAAAKKNTASKVVALTP